MKDCKIHTLFVDDRLDNVMDMMLLAFVNLFASVNDGALFRAMRLSRKVRENNVDIFYLLQNFDVGGPARRTDWNRRCCSHASLERG